MGGCVPGAAAGAAASVVAAGAVAGSLGGNEEIAGHLTIPKSLAARLAKSNSDENEVDDCVEPKPPGYDPIPGIAFLRLGVKEAKVIETPMGESGTGILKVNITQKVIGTIIHGTLGIQNGRTCRTVNKREEVLESNIDGPLFVASYYHGPYGPTIIMKALSADAAHWLHCVLLKLAISDLDDVEIDLAVAPEIEMQSILSLTLRRVKRQPQVALRKTTSTADGTGFEWNQDLSNWSSAAGLLEPFVAGNTGHQYFTTAGEDDALVEISFGEADVVF